MIKIYGSVESGPTPYSVWQTPMGTCFNSCLTDSLCIFAGYMGSSDLCSLYSYKPGKVLLKVVEVEAEEGKYAAFKTNLPDGTCPATYKNVDFIYTSEAGDTYPWQFYPDTNSWKFSACKTGWTRFDRTAQMSVCIKAFLSATKSKRDAVNSTCLGTNTKLVGVQTVAESQWMWAEMKFLTNQKNGTTFWIDGMRYCDPSTEHCNVMEWKDGLTTDQAAIADGNFRFGYFDGPISLYCITINYEEGYTETIKDVNCDYFSADGYFCGYQLKYN